MIVVIILFIIVLVALYWCDNQQGESFDPVTKTPSPLKYEDPSLKYDPITKIKPLLEYDPDKLFTDVVIFNNDDDRMGLDKCLGKCDGTCVEFGVTGIAHCFPANTPYNRNYYNIFRNYENETDDFDRAAKSLVFPNLR
jgi:hypothetical protein